MSTTPSNDALYYEKNLLYKAAWYYYMEGLTQQTIAEKLNISRIRVLRLLEKARQEGVVQIQLNPDFAESLSSEQALINEYQLKDCYIIPTSGDKETTMESLAKTAAMYVSNHISDYNYINFGYGATILKTLNHLAKSISTTISLVSLTGGINYYLPDTKSGLFSAKLNLYPAPLIMSSKELAASLMQEPALAEVSRMTELANLTLIGIGGMNTDSTILKSSHLTNNDYLLLKMQGAVGDLITHFIDADGNLVNPDFDSRIISTPLAKLEELNNVVGVAAGEEKVEAISAALKGHYLDVLITDDYTAEQLIKKSSHSTQSK
ncbi:sugar-binding transcriptional regulator [Hespellia stercorisuis]|uniref:DNA-binding transcriptional regulator LsrR, DeoR family n=1 Tax=Hespellia stercorisuis DSM 15480 TaxID=1121950 RepID=A0A1M6J5K6_9FIRM|nr:sugar-binding transcriptional regulator [Hespellia stercorisuis]SHJ41932.1 DNA-binding transcriptional regulator LsrR, DeoR family [Hespellia stercorisuis DSM 15480]